MTQGNASKIEAFWGEMAPCEHALQIYDGDSDLLVGLEAFVTDGFKKGESVVLVATSWHLATLEKKLRQFDLEALSAADQYIALDARNTLASFMVDNWPNDELFRRTITGILERAGKNGRRVRAFGEMVALLWAQDNSAATIRLEHLWNNLMKVHTFSLFCAYPKGGFTGDAAESLEQICSEHSKIISPNFTETASHVSKKTPLGSNPNAEIAVASEVEHAKWLAAIVESSDDAIIFKDLHGVIKTWNRAAERIFGYAAKEIVGKSVLLLIPEDLQKEEPEILARLRRGERIDHYETVRQRKDGKLIDISLTVSPVKDNAGRIIGASKIARDITARKMVERELAKAMECEKLAREEAETAMSAKDHFLATLSHELRTPLNPILLDASDAAADQELPEKIRERFQNILKNVEVEVHLIDDLLDLSRISHGKLKLKMQALDGHKVLDETMNMVRRDVEAKNIRLTVKLNAQRHRISADGVRLQQVFWNILRNAIKFTPENGEINIETLSTAEKFMVTVKDSGIGMTSDEISRVFSPFSQGDHTYGGLGLGLAISKKLVDLHLGHIQAFSAGRGHGSCISIEFSLANTWSAASDTVLVASNAPEHQANLPKHALVPVLRAG